LHAAAVPLRRDRLADLRLLLGSLPPTLAFLLARGPRRALFLRPVLALLNVLALLPAHRDRLADGHLALLHRDLQQYAREVRFDLLRHLVGVELVERLALLDRLALALQPLDDRPRLHPLPEPRELDLASHAPPSACSPRARRWRAGPRTPPSPARTEAARTSPRRAR